MKNLLLIGTEIIRNKQNDVCGKKIIKIIRKNGWYR